MSKRMQILVEEAEYARFQQSAQRMGISLAEWVRHALRAACRREPDTGTKEKLAAIRNAARHNYAMGNIDQVLAGIERGYGED